MQPSANHRKKNPKTPIRSWLRSLGPRIRCLATAHSPASALSIRNGLSKMKFSENASRRKLIQGCVRGSVIGRGKRRSGRDMPVKANCFRKGGERGIAGLPRFNNLDRRCIRSVPATSRAWGAPQELAIIAFLQKMPGL